MTGQQAPQTSGYVALSEITIEAESARTLEVAFRDRMGLVDQWPGFQRLEVWRDRKKAGTYMMVSWWDSAEQFLAYMRSEDHHVSHARVPADPHKPRPKSFRSLDLIST